MNTRASIGKRLLALIAAAGSVFDLGAAHAQTEPDVVQSAPAEWLAYAATVTDAVKSWLEADTDAASRLRLRLDAMQSPSDSSTLLIKVWIAPDGRVAQVEGPVKDDAQVDADMADIVATARLGPPPPDMPQPLRIGVQLRAY
jgi:hypothetical protein